MQPPHISILIPVYNEIGTIAAIVDLVKAALPGVSKEIIIVDDGSTDGTKHWLAAAFDAAPIVDGLIDASAAPFTKRVVGDGVTVKIIFHNKNQGKGGAVQTAMTAATGDFIVIQDADLEYDPDDWITMFDLLAHKRVADVVYGSRFYGKPHRSLYYHHYFANRLISTIFNILFNQTLTDIEVCYKMFSREVLNTLKITCEDFGFEVQISAQIARNPRWRIYETGVRYYGRTVKEGKKLSWKDGFKALWYLAKFRIRPGN
jgi:glycosyltransferase involved in cell wall biosynthesis